MLTPLYDALRAFADTKPARYHMPGHHGAPLPVPEFPGFSALDFTELPPTGDLYRAGGPIEAAEKLWAGRFNMEHCLFLTGGSTQGLLSALTLACSPGSTVLVDRGCHRAVYHAMALLDLHPVYLPRPWLEQGGVTGPIHPGMVENYLKNHPDIETVCITSPTYYGVLSNLWEISQVIHAHGGKLVVDGAHGAHLPFLGENAYSYADLVVTSAHKTLPAPGQTALLFSGRGFSMDELRRAGKIYGTSSPSYSLMAALDLCRDYMDREGAELYCRTAKKVQDLRRRFAALTELDAPLDPCRFVWKVANGPTASRKLEEMGIYPEMEDTAHVVFILTCADSEEKFKILTDALEKLSPQLTYGGAEAAPALPERFPRQERTPREALFGLRRSAVLEDALGEVSADQIAPYPPGIPVIAPGECIDKKHLSYLSQVGYNIKERIYIL